MRSSRSHIPNCLLMSTRMRLKKKLSCVRLVFGIGGVMPNQPNGNMGLARKALLPEADYWKLPATAWILAR